MEHVVALFLVNIFASIFMKEFFVYTFQLHYILLSGEINLNL